MVAIMSVADRKPSGPRTIGKTRLILLTALAALLVLCLAGYWYTRTAAINHASVSYQEQTNTKPIVSTQPWQTAHALAATAATYQEAKYALRAEQLADRVIDQSFDAALRCAQFKLKNPDVRIPPCDEFHLKPKGNSKKAARIEQHIADLQKSIALENSAIDSSKNTSTTDSDAPGSAAGSDNIQLVKFQLDLDSDRLRDAQQALDQITGIRIHAIRDELAAHENSMKKFDGELSHGSSLPIQHTDIPASLVGRLGIWFGQRDLVAQLKYAQTVAQKNFETLSATLPTGLQLAPAPNPCSARYGELSQVSDNTTLGVIRTVTRDRGRTDLHLACAYASWGHQVQLRNTNVLHLILRSLAAILAVILWMILCDTILRRLTRRHAFARRKTQTLRAIFKVGIQIIGILIILLLIFGPPDQTGTIIGLITAALALALQDYILAFFGWFMLAGPNGISVGDMVEIDGVCGEVVEIGLLKTTLLETSGLREKGEPTGRRVSLLNSFAVHGAYFKFPSEGQWLWDEITITVPADADVYAIAKSVEKLAIEETAESARLAELDWNQNLPSTSLNRISAKPIVMMWPSIALDVSTSIDIQLRYVTRAVGRYEVRDRLYRHVLQLLKDQGHPNPPQQASPSPA